MINKLIKLNIVIVFVLALAACSNGRGANNSAVKMCWNLALMEM